MVEQILSSRGFHNYIKLGIGFLLTKEVLGEFVLEDTEEFLTSILDGIYTNNSSLKRTQTCSSCRTPNVLKCPIKNVCNLTPESCRYHQGSSNTYRVCPNEICHHFISKIIAESRGEPAWKNTDATKWCTSAVELTKCFMPEKGYDDVDSLKETDFHCIISVIMNNKRFQNKLNIRLSDKANLCKKLKSVNNAYRHSATLNLEDHELVEGIEFLITLLMDQKYLSSKSMDVVQTLRELKTDTFEVSSSKICQVLSDAAEEFMTLETKEELKLKLLRQLMDMYKDEAKIVTANAFAEVIDARVVALTVVEECAKNERASIARAGNREQRKLHRTASHLKRSLEKDQSLDDVEEPTHTQTSDVQIKEELRKDLIEFYKSEHKFLPISPLIDRNKAPLLDFYVGPTMYYIDIEKQPFKNEENKFRQPIKSYKDIFFKDKNRCKNIYVTSRAGSGKTCFTKRMTLAWCQSWKPEDCKRECFETENIEAMEDFSFLFHVSLRDCFARECDVDEMIQNQIINKLAGGYKYKGIMQSLLHTENCLILIDGLDEWNHPTKKRKKCTEFQSKIPHRKFRENSTFLTTSRRWKFHAISEDNVHIDQHVEMTGLENESAQMLTRNVIKHLNERSNQSKTPENFNEMLESKGLKMFIHLPLILMQLLSLWYDGKEPGESKCQIFSNMIELLFRHAAKRPTFGDKYKNIQHSKGKRANRSLPSCFDDTKLCKAYKHVLQSLSKMAYESLFGENFDNTLVFDKNIAIRYLSANELSLCLEIGILLQSRESGSLTSEDLTYSFLHKTFQELLAALFISSKTDLPKNMLPKIMKKIKCVDDVLRMDMFLIFLSGLSPGATKILSTELVSLIAGEEMTERYRRNIGTIFIKDFDKMHEFSDLMVSCLAESIRNDHDAEIYLEDIFIDQKCTENHFRRAMSKLIACNNGNVTSIYVHVHQTMSTENVEKILEAVEITSIHSVEKVFIWGDIKASNVESLLNNSVNSLKCLELWQQTLTPGHLSVLCRMEKLYGLSLLSVEMDHSLINGLMSYMSTNDNLELVNLHDIMCKNHHEECPGYELKICERAKPRLFLLDKLHATSVSVNAERIQMCVAEWLYKEGALESLLSCLKTASGLQRLECDGVFKERDVNSLLSSVPNFEKLNYLRLRNINIIDGKLRLSKMKELMRVHIWHVSMTADGFRTIVKDVECLGTSVIVILDECDIKPADDENEMRNYVKKCGNFVVIKEEVAKGKYRQFHFKSLMKSLCETDVTNATKSQKHN